MTLESFGGTFTLPVNSASGERDVSISGATTSLILGTTGRPLNLTVGDSLSVQDGGTIEARFGSDILANNLANGTGVEGTILVDGSGSSLIVSSTNKQFVGVTGTPAALVFQNSSMGNSFAGALGIADTATPSINAHVSVLGGSTVSGAGDITLANQNTAGQVAVLNINGTSSQLTQTGATAITVGSPANGTAAINIGTTATGGQLRTGTGTLTINNTGTVTIGSGANIGTLDTDGDVLIDGGALVRNLGSVFLLSTGRTMTIQNGGSARFTGPFSVGSMTTYNISGTDSILETTAITNTLTINSASQVTVSSQGTLSSRGPLAIGTNTNGTLVVDGVSSRADAQAGSQWGTSGGTANVTFRNGAIGSFPNGLILAPTSAANTTANVSVLSARILSSGSMTIAFSGGATTSGTVTVDGAGSLLVPGSSFTIGHASTGTAVIHVQNGGSLLVNNGGTTVLHPTGTININGGTVDLRNLNDNGGTINFNDGSLSYNGPLTVGTGGLLGENLTLENKRQLTVNGTTTIDAGRRW